MHATSYVIVFLSGALIACNEHVVEDTRHPCTLMECSHGLNVYVDYTPYFKGRFTAENISLDFICDKPRRTHLNVSEVGYICNAGIRSSSVQLTFNRYVYKNPPESGDLLIEALDGNEVFSGNINASYKCKDVNGIRCGTVCCWGSIDALHIRDASVESAD
jgi:hypothetical protein